MAAGVVARARTVAARVPDTQVCTRCSHKATGRTHFGSNRSATARCSVRVRSTPPPHHYGKSRDRAIGDHNRYNRCPKRKHHV